MYELGYSIAAGKDVVIISGDTSGSHPFNIQHRGIISYRLESPRDFELLRRDIAARAKSILQGQDKKRDIASRQPLRTTQGLEHYEISALAFLLASSNGPGDSVPPHVIRTDMERAGYTDVATKLALIQLRRHAFIESVELDDRDGPYLAYRIIQKGEEWLLENRDKLELRLDARSHSRSDEGMGVDEDDVPF